MKTKILANYHPAASLHNPRLWAVLLDDWSNLAVDEVDHSYIIVSWDNLEEKLGGYAPNGILSSAPGEDNSSKKIVEKGKQRKDKGAAPELERQKPSKKRKNQV